MICVCFPSEVPCSAIFRETETASLLCITLTILRSCIGNVYKNNQIASRPTLRHLAGDVISGDPLRACNESFKYRLVRTEHHSLCYKLVPSASHNLSISLLSLYI